MDNLKWSYMDHWLTHTPRGPVTPDISIKYLDRYIKQLAGLGYTGFDTFGARLYRFAGMFGSIKKFEEFLQEGALKR